jgi:hypothetical protein
MHRMIYPSYHTLLVIVCHACPEQRSGRKYEVGTADGEDSARERERPVGCVNLDHCEDDASDASCSRSEGCQDGQCVNWNKREEAS